VIWSAVCFAIPVKDSVGSLSFAMAASSHENEAAPDGFPPPAQ
jgi:hypothetical protein